nr:EamA family transporter [Clostridium tyrobutyricum]
MNYLVLVCMTIIGAFAGFSLKKSTSQSSSIFKVILSKWFYIGSFLYLMGALLNIYVLKFLPYTVVLPMTSLTYIWTMIISFYLLKEKITFKKILGVMLILIGAFLISIS